MRPPSLNQNVRVDLEAQKHVYSDDVDGMRLVCLTHLAREDDTTKQRAAEKRSFLRDTIPFKHTFLARSKINSTATGKESRSTFECNSQKDDGSFASDVSTSRVFPMCIAITLIVFLGAATSAAFLVVGISGANMEQSDQFNRLAHELVTQIQQSGEDYVTAASAIHGQCRGRNFTRSDFRQTYEYLLGTGLDFQAAQFDPKITREERDGAEAEARAFYAQHYPHVNYRGIIGFETDNSTVLEPRSEQDFYFPAHVSYKKEFGYSNYMNDVNLPNDLCDSFFASAVYGASSWERGCD
jgi:hypothetical protein